MPASRLATVAGAATLLLLTGCDSATSATAGEVGEADRAGAGTRTVLVADVEQTGRTREGGAAAPGAIDGMGIRATGLSPNGITP